MQLSQQQNSAITQTLIEYYNGFLTDMITQVFTKQCANLQGSEQVDTFMFNIQYTLKQSCEQHFNRTKSSLFEFIQNYYNNKMTETAFKTIFDKYFIPASYQSQKQLSGDQVLQMGIILIINNICPIFQQKTKVKKYIQLIQQNKLPNDLFQDELDQIISQIQRVMHSQLLGQPLPKIELKSKAKSRNQLDQKTKLVETESHKLQKECKQCQKSEQEKEMLKQMIKLLEQKNQILVEELENVSLCQQSIQSSRDVYHQNPNQLNEHNIKKTKQNKKQKEEEQESPLPIFPTKQQKTNDQRNNTKQSQKQQLVKQTMKQSEKKKLTIKPLVISSSEESGSESNSNSGSGSGSGSESGSSEEEFEDVEDDYQETDKGDLLDLSGDGDFSIEC